MLWIKLRKCQDEKQKFLGIIAAIKACSECEEIVFFLLYLEINPKQIMPPKRIIAVCTAHINVPDAIPVVSGSRPYNPNNCAISTGYAPIPPGVRMIPTVPTTNAASPPGKPRYCVSFNA